MPVYDYRCPECGKAFSVTERITVHGEKPVRCPQCKTRNVEQAMGAFHAKTSRKS